MLTRIIALAFVAILFMGMVVGAQQGYRQSVIASESFQSAGNESFTVTAGGVVTLNESNQNVVYNGSVTVTQDGTTYQADGNYTWLTHNGTLKIPSDTGLTDGQTAYIEYGYHEPTGTHKLARTALLWLPSTLGGALVLVLGLTLVMGAVAVMAKQGGY